MEVFKFNSDLSWYTGLERPWTTSTAHRQLGTVSNFDLDTMAAILEARRPPHPDVTTIPTPPLQRTALFINFFFPALAVVAVGLRVFSRVKSRQWGLGMLYIAIPIVNDEVESLIFTSDPRRLADRCRIGMSRQ